MGSELRAQSAAVSVSDISSWWEVGAMEHGCFSLSWSRERLGSSRSARRSTVGPSSLSAPTGQIGTRLLPLELEERGGRAGCGEVAGGGLIPCSHD
jgi:hypothetical protein